MSASAPAIVEINSVATLAKEGRIAVISINSPPVNALSLAVREGLQGGLRTALDDPEVRAIILICEGCTFFAGADINDFGKPLEHPSLWDVVDALDGADKPIVAAMHGTALGGGFEVALACHYRVAAASFKCGLPEVKLGLLPAAGGTQRLPRLIGAETALEMIVSGNPVDAQRALETGIVDDIVADGALRDEALAFASERIAEGCSLRRLRDNGVKLPAGQDRPGVFTQFREQNAKRLAGLDAPQACLEAVEAACSLSFEEGLALERRLFERLVDGTQARALRHLFFAERKLARIPGIPADTPSLPFETVGVVGAGTMGRGIAMAFLNADFPVALVERSEVALKTGMAATASSYDSLVKRGRLREDVAKERISRLHGSLDFAALAECDLVVEAVFEDMVVKKQLFGELDAIVKADAILATNTSFLDIDEIAAATARPERVVGLHFFSPANIMRLLEVVRGRETNARMLVTAMAIGRKLGKLAVLVGNCHGFVGNRILASRQREAERLMMEGVKPWDIDRVHVEFGMPMGPFAMYDLAGLDLGWSEATSRGETVVERLCEAGCRGQKTGAGFYDYGESRRPLASTATEEIIAAVAEAQAIAPRQSADAEIWQRCTYPMINEAVRILEDGIAIRPSDIDLIWINGYGWPAQTGGPLFYADTIGLDHICSRLEYFEQQYGADFAPAPLLMRLASEGKGFATL